MEDKIFIYTNESLVSALAKWTFVVNYSVNLVT